MKPTLEELKAFNFTTTRSAERNCASCHFRNFCEVLTMYGKREHAGAVVCNNYSKVNG